jgi:hypothetical protein
MGLVHPVVLAVVLLSLLSGIVMLGSVSAWLIVAFLTLLAAISYDRSRIHIALRLLRYLTLGLAFLFILYGIDFSNWHLASNLRPVLEYSVRLFSLFTVMYILTANVDQDRLFAALVNLQFPISVIYLMFRTFWIVTLFETRAEEIVAAQRLRGFPTETLAARLTALGRGARALVNGLLVEMIDANVALESKGISRTNRPVSATQVPLGMRDLCLVVGTSLAFLGCAILSV